MPRLSGALEQAGGTTALRTLLAISPDLPPVGATSQRAQSAYDASKWLCLWRAGNHYIIDLSVFLRLQKYSLQALRCMANSNGGLIICPRTKETFAFKDAEKVYVM